MSDASKNPIVRLIVPLVILVVGGIGAWWVMTAPGRGSSGTPNAQTSPAAATTPSGASPSADTSTPPAPASTAAPTEAGQPADPSKATETAASTTPAAPTGPATPAATPSGAPAATPAANTQKFRARPVPITTFATVGSVTPKDKGGKHELELTFSPIGAGVERVRLANHFTTIKNTEHQTVQEFAPLPSDPRLGLSPYAVDAVVIGEQRVSLWATDATAAEQTFWRETGPGVFEAIIEDESGQPAFRVTRAYQLAEGSYEFTIRQSVENLTGTAWTVRFVQFGPADVPMSMVRYGGDVRRVRFGYLRPVPLDPDQIVQSGDNRAAMFTHSDAVGSATGTLPGTFLPSYAPRTLWPNATSIDRQLTPVWAAMTDRYFSAAVHMPVPAQASGGSATFTGPAPSRALTLGETVERLAIPVVGGGERGRPVGVVALRLTSAPIALAAGSAADVSVAGYVGPISRLYIAKEPAASRVGLEQLLIFTFGGPCGFCTFQWLAWGLRGFLGFLHDNVFFDWSLAIMFLVVCVRSLLHPVTRWAQTNMIRFGKHMSKLAPKQKAIQEKYGDDPVKMREEIARLMREEHVSYSSGAMGCLPMFLQMPVWVALYAMLYFTFELRHEHAFYGVVQAATGHGWGFMGDLAEPDHFLSFGTAIWIPLLSQLMGPIEALNILPLVMGVVFYIQQKYMTPPTSVQLSPEQEQQQKIMKVMMVVMMPLFMYNAPSGLALYFLTNSTLGILESKWIRARAEKIVEAEDRKRDELKAQRKAKGEPEKETFMARMQRMVEEQQKIREAQKKALEKKMRK